jgi:hypothetical protein
MAGRLAGQLAVVPDGDVCRGAPGHLAGGERGELGQRSLLCCGSEAEQASSAFGEIGAGQRGTSLNWLGRYRSAPPLASAWASRPASTVS